MLQYNTSYMLEPCLPYRKGQFWHSIPRTMRPTHPPSGYFLAESHHTLPLKGQLCTPFPKPYTLFDATSFEWTSVVLHWIYTSSCACPHLRNFSRYAWLRAESVLGCYELPTTWAMYLWPVSNIIVSERRIEGSSVNPLPSVHLQNAEPSAMWYVWWQWMWIS